MTAIFGFALFAGSRMLNEEFLMGYRPITRKIAEAIYLVMAHARPYFSVPLWSLLVIPAVYLVQIVFLAFATNLPFGHDPWRCARRLRGEWRKSPNRLGSWCWQNTAW